METIYTFKDALRFVVLDAAHSLSYGEDIEVDDVMSWFDTATIEDLQHVLMGAVQDALRTELGVYET